METIAAQLNLNNSGLKFEVQQFIQANEDYHYLADECSP